MMQHIKMLSKVYALDILWISEGESSKDSKTILANYANAIIPFDFPKIQFYWNSLIGLLANKNPIQVNYFYFKKVQQWIDQHAHRYDILFCSTVRMAEYVRKIKGSKIIDFVDAISMNYAKAVKNKGIGLWKLLYYIDSKRVLDYEWSILKDFNKKIIISQIDRDFILRDAQAVSQIYLVHNSVPVHQNQKSCAEKNQICFLGKMNYEPNVSAVRYFAKSIFPKLLALHPQLEFRILGAFPNAAVKQLGVQPNITVTGFVKALRQNLYSAKLVVAPMVTGAGIQNKILIAMACGRCVVTTPLGAEGLIELSGTDDELVIAQDSQEMIEKIDVLLREADKRTQIGQNAKKYVSKFYSEQKISNQLLSILEN